jgi:hypothetical protein
MTNRAIPIVLLTGTLTACGIPDLQPFGDATTAMVTTLRQGFEKARATLATVAERSDDDRLDQNLRRLDEQWAPTRKALSSLVAYADSLTAVAKAGKQGKETMGQVTGALNDLATAVGAIPLAGGGKQIVEAVGAKIIQMQAARDIRKAVSAAADAVDLIAPVLERNFADLRSIHNAAAVSWENRVLEESSFRRNYYASLADEEQRLEYLLTLIIGFQSAPARLQWRAALARAQNNEELAAKLLGSVDQEQRDHLQALKAADPAFAGLTTGDEGTRSFVEGRQQHLLGLIRAQREEIALLEPAYREFSDELAAVHEARATGNQILQKAGEAIAAWQKAHRSLQATAEGLQRRPSLADLLSIVTELATLVS